MLLALISLFRLAILISAWGLEIQSLLLAIKQGASEGDLIYALILHVSACVLNAIILAKFLAGRYQTSFIMTFLLFGVIPFYMPVLGIFGMTFAMVPPLLRAKTVRSFPVHFNKIRTFPETSFGKGDPFQARVVDLEALLRSKDPDKRLNAVYATLKLDDQKAVPLLKKALRDPVDDIRLLAYALIDRKEQRICERIEYAKRSLENQGARQLYRSIVNDYWELAHLGLVEGETLNYMLQKAKEYLEMGLKRYPDDRGLHLQYAKLLLRMGRTGPSYEEFKKAEDLGVDRKKLSLYYAEINFLHRRFDEVKRYMSGAELVAAAPQIRSTARFWQKREGAGEFK